MKPKPKPRPKRPASASSAPSALSDPSAHEPDTRPRQPPIDRSGAPFIRARGLRKHFDEQLVLDGIDLDVWPGEVMVLLGRSGEGKSVFLKHLLGLFWPDEGRIEIDGIDVTGLNERQMAVHRRKLGILFQDGALFDSMTVAENVAFPLREGGVSDRSEIDRRVREALEVVELAEHMDKMPVNLSGGMRKRVALARAIVPEPACVLYDEPTSGLDPVVADVINHLIRRLQRRFGLTSVVVTHDMESVWHVADRVAYLRSGQVYFQGTPDQLRHHPDPVIQDFIHGRSGMADD